MPIYEYECRQCAKVTEVWQSFSDEPLTKCPDCAGELRKLISMSSFQLKGGGWYADGYASTSKNGGGGSCATAKKESSENSAGCSAEKKAACGCSS